LPKASPKSLKIAIQGVRASFHDVAARHYFSDTEIEALECPSFKNLCENLANRQADFALMAIENSIAGSILTNYSLLERNSFKTIGEVYLRIELSVMALPGRKLEQLKFVQSHPMALLQCEDFLASQPHLKVLEAADTAESAKDIKEKGLSENAAIASQLAAEVYGLEVLQSGIETNKQNYTRFLVISRGERHHENEVANKASVRFETSHRPGSLVKALSCLQNHGVNMTKIQSVPILGRPYEYSFHLDLEWEDAAQYCKALSELERATIGLIHFGEYRKSDRPTVDLPK
jgi:prephenate dehydratase